MNGWQIALITVLPIFALVGTIAALLYYVIMPNKLVKAIRGGTENLKVPDDFDQVTKLVNIERNLTYQSTFPHSNYDLYRPICSVAKGLVIWVHGGFFIAGDKAGVENVCTAISAKGYNVAAINYATAPEHKYPSAIRQLDNFIEDILTNSPTLADNGIIIAGDSAGGQMTAQYTLLVSSMELQHDMDFKPTLAPSLLRAFALVCAPIDMGYLRGMHKAVDFLLPTFGRAYFGSGRWYKSKKYCHTHLYNYIHKELPPCFITDGNRVSFEAQNKKLATVLHNEGVQVQSLFFDKSEYGDINHEYLFDLTLDTSQMALEQLIAFIDHASC